MRRENEGRSPWLWILGGCGGCLVLAVVAVVGLGFAGFQWTKGLVEDLENPQARAAKARAVLGAEALPEGYYAAMAISVPWMVDMAILTDKEVHFERRSEDSLDIDLADEDFGDRVFMFFRARTFGSAEDDVEDFFRGRNTGSVNVNSGNIQVRVRGLYREGELEVRGQPVRYRIDRGELTTEHGETEGLVTRLHFRCPESKRLHLALWTGPAAGPLDDPDTAEPGVTEPDVTEPDIVEAGPVEQPPAPLPEEPSVAGIPADEPGMRDFLSHFDLCA